MIYMDLSCNRVYSCYHLRSCIRNALQRTRRKEKPHLLPFMKSDAADRLDKSKDIILGHLNAI